MSVQSINATVAQVEDIAAANVQKVNGAVNPFAEMQAEMARLQAENESLRKANARKLGMKVSEKGALSIYGLGKFPFTFYREQIEKILAMADEIRAFIVANDKLLVRKPVK